MPSAMNKIGGHRWTHEYQEENQVMVEEDRERGGREEGREKWITDLAEESKVMNRIRRN